MEKFKRMSTLKDRRIILKYILILFICWPLLGFSQSDEPKSWAVNGYVKDLRTFYLNNLDTISIDNLLHHRFNFKWFINEHFTFKTDVRNRIFYGDLVERTPGYADLIDDINNDVLDLSWVLLDRNSVVIHSMIDRLYLDYVNNNLEVRLGRQRINWGINLIWNPNDIFNSYSFFDFDYEERPGSDALRVTYYTGASSSVEFAVKAFEEVEDLVAAGLWKTNKWTYDFQVLGGVAQKDIVLGGGWAGNIKNAGFKGEFSTFTPYDNTDTTNTDIVFAGTMSIDYSLRKGTFMSGGMLFNSNGANSLFSGLPEINLATGLQGIAISAKNLYPYKWTLFGQISHPLGAAANAGVALIYSPGEDHAFFINPTVSYSIRENWDLDLVGQMMALKLPGQGYQLPLGAAFLRVKWSY